MERIDDRVVAIAQSNFLSILTQAYFMLYRTAV